LQSILYEDVEAEKSSHVAPEEIEEALSRWNIPEIPSVSSSQMKPELALLSWLWQLVKQNVKRGRMFQLRDVLLHQQADCLGLAQLLSCLGKRYCLDIGIVEVVIDNAGRYTSHYVNVVKIPPRSWHFVDLWYGSKDIKHRRMGLQVKEGNEWRTKDIDWEELEKVPDIRGLPDSYIEGIIHYILGNRHLERGIRCRSGHDLDIAIKYFTEAINLYPGCVRAYFNRAIAYENMGDHKRAQLDYEQALKDEAGQIRILAREHEEVVKLIELDRANVGPREQEIYLFKKGFFTGEEVAPAIVARHFGISEREVSDIVSQIETICQLV
jgi:tetratricopeptide (TPR) repeat protein